MKEKALITISPEQAQKILLNSGLKVTLEEAADILNFLYKIAEITLQVYMDNPE